MDTMLNGTSLKSREIVINEATKRIKEYLIYLEVSGIVSRLSLDFSRLRWGNYAS